MILQKEIIMQQPRDPESKAKSSYFTHKDRCLSTTFSGRSLHTVTSGASRGMPAHGLEYVGSSRLMAGSLNRVSATGPPLHT